MKKCLDIMWRRTADCTDVKDCVFLDSALVGAQESTILDLS